MPTTSIKVPVELRDRLSALARRRQMNLAAAITHALDVAESAEFWERGARFDAGASFRRHRRSR